MADLLRDEIENGEYRPGDQLPSVADLAEAHQMSRETVRKASAILRSEGLIEVTPGYGTRVRVPDADTEADEDLTVVALQRGSRCRIRRATRTERAELGIGPGVPVLEVRLGSRVRVFAGDRSLFTIA